MSEVSTWNATDNANTAAPPDGWPEGMQPSAVNDAARMMMGALRREHDRISAQIGSTTGTISTTTINATTVNTTGAITASGPITGSALNSTGNASVAGTLTAGFISTPQINVSGTVTAGTLTSTGNINAAGTVTAAQLTSTGNINATGGIAAGGAVSGSYIHSTGNLDAVGTISGPQLTSTGNINAAAGLVANTVYSNNYLHGTYVWGGASDAGTLQMWGSADRINFRWDGGVSGGGAVAWRVNEAVEKYFTTTVNTFDLQYSYPGGGPTTAVMGGHDVPGTWYYSFIDYLSDERIKDNIAPTEIDAVGALQQVPVSQFDVKGAVAAWIRNIGMDTPERIASMQGAEPVHVPIGFVAQRIQPHMPNAVTVARQDGAIPEAPLPVDVLNINKQEFIPYLVRAIQQLAARIEQLEAGGT